MGGQIVMLLRHLPKLYVAAARPLGGKLSLYDVGLLHTEYLIAKI